MSENNEGLLILIMAVFAYSVLVGYIWGRIAGYKVGQIDCLNGEIKYEKKETENKELKWTRK